MKIYSKRHSKSKIPEYLLKGAMDSLKYNGMSDDEIKQTINNISKPIKVKITNP